MSCVCWLDGHLAREMASILVTVFKHMIQDSRFKNFIGVTMTETCLTNTYTNNKAQWKKKTYTQDTPHKTIYKTNLLNHMAAFQHRKWYTRISLILCTCWREREKWFLNEIHSRFLYNSDTKLQHILITSGGQFMSNIYLSFCTELK